MKAPENLIIKQVHAAIKATKMERLKLIKSDNNKNFKNKFRHKRFIHPKHTKN